MISHPLRSVSLPGRPDGLRKLRRNSLHQFIRQQFLDDWLLVVRIKCLAACISLEEVEDSRIIAIPANAVVYRSRFELGESGRLGIDRFESVGVLGVSVDLMERCSSQKMRTLREGIGVGGMADEKVEVGSTVP